MMPSAFTAPVLPDPEQAIAFFRLLFPQRDGSAVVHFRGVPEPKPEHGNPGSRNLHYVLDERFDENVRGFVNWCHVDGRAAYFLPGTVHAQGTGKKDVTSLPALCVDFDKGDPSTNLTAAEAAIGPATIVVESGGATEKGPKIHAYWVLQQPAKEAAIDEACHVREELAKRFEGDPAFKQAAQVIRIPGSIHFKGEPKLVRLRTVRPEAAISLQSALDKLTISAPKVGNPPSNVIRPAVWDLNAVRYDTDDTGRALTQPIHEGAVDDMTRFEGAGKAIGHFIRMAREGRMTLDEAWQATCGWNTATLVPPWPESRLRGDFDRLVSADLKDKGPFIPPAPAMSITTPAGLVVLERRADRFAGEAPKRQWLVEGLIPLATPGVFAAVGDAGKSLLALRLALFASCYGPSVGEHDLSDPMFFGCPVRTRGAVVMLTGEDDDAELHRRLNSLDPTHIRKGKPLYIVSMISEGGARAILMDGPAGPQPTPFWADLATQLAAIPDLKFVIFDPLSTFTGADLNDNAVGAALMTMLASLASKTGAAVMVVHHLNKGSSPTDLRDARNAIRGAGALVDNSRWSLVMWEATQDEAFTALDALGRKQEALRAGVVYKGGIAKSNAPGRKVLRTLVRGPEGLLEDMTDTIRNSAVGAAEIDTEVHRMLVRHWQEVMKGEWSFGGVGRTKVHNEVYPVLLAQGSDLSVDEMEASIKRLLKAGKIKQQKGGKGPPRFEPVA